jgi:hypothetical protein
VAKETNDNEIAQLHKTGIQLQHREKQSNISTMVIPTSGVVRGNGKGRFVEECIDVCIVHTHSFSSNVAVAPDVGLDLGEGEFDGIVVRRIWQ